MVKAYTTSKNARKKYRFLLDDRKLSKLKGNFIWGCGEQRKISGSFHVSSGKM